MPARRTVLAGLAAAPFAAATARAAAAASPGERVASGLRPAFEVAGRPRTLWAIGDRLVRYKVPGASIAVVDGGRPDWAGAFGVADAASGRKVDTETAFQAASISKMIAANVTLALVDRGMLDLDRDVNAYLTSWQVPGNAFTAREKVTLRRILSHRAGFSVHGFRGYRPDGPRPTILEVLDGRAPAENKPVRVEFVPGTRTQYSGGGVSVEQLVDSDVTGKTFESLAEDYVLGPAGLTRSSFRQPPPASIAANLAKAHDAEGAVVPGGWSIGPELAAAWLWTTPSDLMRWAVAIDDARLGAAHAILKRATVAGMLTAQGGEYGLGPLLEGAGRAFRFGHGGNNTGFRAQVFYFPATRQGCAIMVNGEGGDFLIDEIVRAVAAEYGWPALAPEKVAPVLLSPAQRAAVAGRYDLAFPGADKPLACIIAQADGALRLTLEPVLIDDEIVAQSLRRFVSPVVGYALDLDVSGGGKVNGFTLTYNGTPMKAVARPPQG